MRTCQEKPLRSQIVFYTPSKKRNELKIIGNNGRHLKLYQSVHDSIRDVRFKPKVVRLATKGSNPGLFRSDFSIFWRNESKCTETWSEKTRISPIWDQSDLVWFQIWGPWFQLKSVKSNTCVKCYCYLKNQNKLVVRLKSSENNN